MEQNGEAAKEAAKQVSGTQPGKKKSGMAKAVCVLAVLAFICAVGASVGMNVVLMGEMRAQKEQGAKMSRFIDDERARQAKEAEKESSYQEDGYVVMGQYEIRSTKEISDAYVKSDPSGLSGEDKETYDMAAKVLEEIIRDGMNSYEKELAIYEWMLENLGAGRGHVIAMPGQSSACFTPHDVLKNKSAVCVGYATTFRLLANMVGLEVHIVHNESHSWDMVKLDDGEWYQLDIWADGAMPYRNFNVTDEVMRARNEWDGSALPEAKGTKYSYAVQNAKPLKSLEDLPKKIKKAIDNKKDALFFKLPRALTEEERNVADQMMSLITQAISTLPEGGEMDITGNWVPNGEDDNHVLAIYFHRFSGDSTVENDLSPEKAKELVKLINEVFGTTLTDSGTSGGEKAVPFAESAGGGTVTLDANGNETYFMVDENGDKIFAAG